MSKFSEYVDRGKRQHGDKFTASELDPRFVQFYNSGARVKIDIGGTGEHILTGTIGATTGWRPCFLLMRTSRSVGSMWTLGPKDKIVAVQDWRGRYSPFYAVA